MRRLVVTSAADDKAETSCAVRAGRLIRRRICDGDGKRRIVGGMEGRRKMVNYRINDWEGLEAGGWPWIVFLALVIFGGAAEASTKVVAVKGGQAELPCDLTPPEPGDEVFMVLWFKRRSQTPIYTLDVRNRDLSEGMHRVNEVWANDFRTGKQANFLALADPPVLALVGVDEDDAAPYTCRVDFRHSQTRYSKVDLVVIVPPERPVIRDDHGMQVRAMVGPKNEGDDLTLTCETKGGDPAPTLTWWLGSSLLDNSFKETSPSVYKNKLHLQSLKRQDLQSVLTCQATNNNISLPQSESIKLDMNLRPQSVKISGDVSKQVSAGKQYKLICSASGSRPPAVLTWWIGGRQIAPRTDGQQGSSDGDRTESVLLFNPTRLDDGKTIKCQARNPNLDHIPPLEDSQVLHVLYPPVLELRYGNKLNPEHIKVGDDAYFECDVRSSPPLKSLLWMKGEDVIKHNKTAGIIVVNQTLVLQNLRETQAGPYKCVAENSEGTTDSNLVELKIKYPPKCQDPAPRIYGLSIHEILNVTCNVDAEPPATEFYWTFNSSSTEANPSASPSGKPLSGLDTPSGATVISKQVLAVGKQNFLIYNPRSASDYGDIACKAKNSVGEQAEPCWFQVIEAGPPDPLENCSIHNRTDTWLHVECNAGFDGGSRQQFVMELWYPDLGMLVRRIITDTEPNFTVGNLDDDNEHSSNSPSADEEQTNGGKSGGTGGKSAPVNAKTTRSKVTPAVGGSSQDGGSLGGASNKRSFAGMSLLVVLYSKNAKGQSATATLEARMPQVMENRMGEGQSGRLALPLLISPIIAILFGVGSVLVTVTITVCAVLKCRLYQKRRREASSGSPTPANNNASGANSSGNKDPGDHPSKSLIIPAEQQGSSRINQEKSASVDDFTGNRSPDIIAHLLEAPPSDRDMQEVGIPSTTPGAQQIHHGMTSGPSMNAQHLYAYQQQQQQEQQQMQQIQLMGSLRRQAKAEYQHEHQQIMMDGGSSSMSKSWGVQQHVPQAGAGGFQYGADQLQQYQNHQMLHQSLVTLSTTMASEDDTPLYFTNTQQQFQYPPEPWGQQGPRMLPTIPAATSSPSRLKSALTVRFAGDQDTGHAIQSSPLPLNSNSLQRQKQIYNRQRLVPGTPVTDEIGLPTLTSIVPPIGNPGSRIGPEGCQQSSLEYLRTADGAEVSREQSIV